MSRINMNDDIAIEISYPKDPDEVFTSLMVLYDFELVATKILEYTKFSFRIMDLYSDINPEKSEILFRFSVYDPEFFMPF